MLATSLLDQKRYPHREFKRLYCKRWKIETFFQVIKSRLAVDNFTGRTVEAIKHDFFSAPFVTGLKTNLSAEVNGELAAKKTRHQQQGNKAISFHAIKESIFESGKALTWLTRVMERVWLTAYNKLNMIKRWRNEPSKEATKAISSKVESGEGREY